MMSSMADIPAIIGGKKKKDSKELILPSSKLLQDPMKNVALKENIPPPKKKQSSLAKHVKHGFALPAVKKAPAVLGNFRDVLPSKMRHRACPLCTKIFSNKTSCKSFETPSTHIVSSACHFIKANFQNQIGHGKICHICLERFPPSKTLNETILNHFLEFNHDVRCPFCNKIMPFNQYYEHLVQKSHRLFDEGVHCTRCRHTFCSPVTFWNHFSEIHQVKRPNWMHFNRHLPNNLANRELIIFALLLQGTSV